MKKKITNETEDKEILSIVLYAFSNLVVSWKEEQYIEGVYDNKNNLVDLIETDITE